MPILVVALAALLVVSIAGSWVFRDRRTEPAIRHALAVVMIVLLSAPASVLLTLLLLPLWRWLEEHYGVEAVGHSGPAEWCFGTMFVACVAALASLCAVRARQGTAGTAQKR